MNVQQEIIKGIREQLFHHDYLVLPHFGGFVLKSSPTHFSGAAFILPPSKTISFNAQLRQSDGILAAWLQNRLQCSASESQLHLKEFAEFCNSILNAKRRLTLDGIGFFYLDFENNLCFEPQPDVNFLSDSFGLSAISLREIEPEKTELKREIVFTDRLVETSAQKQERPVKKSLNYRRILAPAAIFLLMGLLVLFISNNRISGQLRASLTGNYNTSLYQPVEYPELNLSLPEKDNSTYVADANGIAVIDFDNTTLAVKAVEHAANTVNVVKTSGHKSRYTLSPGTDYAIVLGSFSVLENAERMAEKLSRQNIEATISVKNAKGFYTVSNGSFDSKDAALARLQELKAGYPKAWIRNP
ncbi:MAG: SPOR domain-containing protein [Bacteroidota bacterium]